MKKQRPPMYEVTELDTGLKITVTYEVLMHLKELEPRAFDSIQVTPVYKSMGAIDGKHKSN